jgi:serine/threonine protein kinase
LIERVEMITCGGREAEKSIFEIDFDQGEDARDGFRERHGVLVHSGGERILQRIAYTDEARRELGRAVKNADNVVRRLGVTRYPRELTRVVGHRPDGRAPFLVTTRRGRPLAEVRDELPLKPGQLWTAVDGIIAVLTQLHDLRLVHRDIRPETLLWDGAGVQLAEFYLGAHEGDERRGPVGADPWRSPEQAAGLGKADCRDDVYSAGAVIFHLATGEEIGPSPDMRERMRYLDGSLRTLLDRVFTDLARERASGFGLRQRREGQSGRGPAGSVPGAPEPMSVTRQEMQARDNFRDLRARQRAFNARSVPPPYRPPARSPARPPRTARDRTPVLRAPLTAVAAAVLLVAVLILLVVVELT